MPRERRRLVLIDRSAATLHNFKMLVSIPLCGNSIAFWLAAAVFFTIPTRSQQISSNALDVSIRLRGKPSTFYFLPQTPGGNGGEADVRTGIEADAGNGGLGDLSGSTTLGPGTYNHRQVGTPNAPATISFRGEVTIRCQNLFSASVTGIYPPDEVPPRLRIYAGPAIFKQEINGQQTEALSTHYARVTITRDDFTYPDRGGVDGGAVLFWTTQQGDIAGGIAAQGAQPVFEGDAGNGGGSNSSSLRR